MGKVVMAAGGDGGDVGRMRWCDERGGGSDCGGRLWLPEGVEARGGGDLIDPGRIYLSIIWDSPEKLAGKVCRNGFPAAATWWWPDSDGEGEKKKMSVYLCFIVAGDRFPGRHVARDMSNGKARWGARAGRQRRANIVSVKQLSATVEGFPRRLVARDC
ncbi:hypothetical protein Tco_0330865 [Tanacetum coccineum]